jgi:hypothetical protein
MISQHRCSIGLIALAYTLSAGDEQVMARASPNPM